MSGPPLSSAGSPPTDAQVAAVVESLPPCFLREYVRYAATQSDAPLLFHVGAGLAALSVSLPAQAYLWGAGSPLYGNVYSLLVGSSALARKSTAIGTAEYLLRGVDPNMVSLPPGSYEGLLSVLSLQPQVLVVESEFSRFLSQSRSQGGGHMTALKLGYVDLYDCKATGRKLSRETTEVMNPRLSILGGIAPSYLEEYLEPHDLTGGFLSRFFVCYGERTEYRRPKGYDQDAFVKLLHMIAHRRYAMPEAPAMLSPNAAETYWSWYEQLDEVARAADERKAGLISRAGTLAYKIALILGLDIFAAQIPMVQGNPIGTPRPQAPSYVYNLPDSALHFAIEVAKWHYLSAMHLIDGLAPDADMRLRRDVMRTIRAQYDQTREPLIEGRLAARTQTTLRRLRPILETLVAEGRVVHVAGTATGGRAFLLTEHVAPGITLPPVSAPGQNDTD